MDRAGFRFADNFPNLTDEQVGQAWDDVEAMFYGVHELWSTLPADIRDKKRELAFQYLTGWLLLDQHPTEAVGVIGNGGMAIQSKSIGGTSLSFSDLGIQDGLIQLNSNSFGQKFLLMLQSAPERILIHG